MDGTHFFVMEFVDGVDLGRLVKQSGPLPVGQACDYVRQAACGLAHAHEKGLIHRDIKPTNLMVTTRSTDEVGGASHPWGLVKILDLGLARSRIAADTEESATVTHAGLVIGTPDFLAPEQAADAKQADIRADIYSLGGTAYFLLTGEVPFPGGSTIDKLVRQRFEEPVPVRKLRPEVPPALAGLVLGMLAKKPADRPQTPSDVASAFRPWCKASGEVLAGSPRWRITRSTEPTPETAPPSPATLTSRVLADRRRWNVTVAAGAVCLVASLALLLFLLGRDGKGPGQSAAGFRRPASTVYRPGGKARLRFSSTSRPSWPLSDRCTATRPWARRAAELLQQLPSAFDALAAIASPARGALLHSSRRTGGGAGRRPVAALGQGNRGRVRIRKASSWSAAARTVSCTSGMRPPANAGTPCPGTPARLVPWRFAVTAR